jgi:hypothetical protein
MSRAAHAHETCETHTPEISQTTFPVLERGSAAFVLADRRQVLREELLQS